MSSRFNESAPRRLARIVNPDPLSDKVRALITAVHDDDDWGIMLLGDVVRRFGRDALRSAHEHGFVEASDEDHQDVEVTHGGLRWARSGKALPGVDNTVRVKTYPPAKGRICRHCRLPANQHVTACDSERSAWMSNTPSWMD